MTAIKAHPAQVRVQVQGQVQGPDSRKTGGWFAVGGCVDTLWVWQREADRRDMMRLTHAMQGPTSVGQPDILTV